MIDYNYFDDCCDNQDYELEKYIRHKRKAKLIVFGILGLLLTCFVTVSIIALNTEEINGYEIVVENDFNQNFSDKDVIDKYFPK